jgi:hypothetical protein
MFKSFRREFYPTNSSIFKRKLTFEIFNSLYLFFSSKEYQTIQRSIIIDLQKLSDHNLLLSSDIKATEYLQERSNHLREIHLNLEQKFNQLRVRNSHFRRTKKIFSSSF